MTRIVTSTYRYKPPPKRKGGSWSEITGPAVVTAKGSRRPGPLRGGGQAAAEVGKAKSYAHPQGAGDAQSSTSAPVPERRRAAGGSVEATAARERSLTNQHHGLPTPRTTLRDSSASVLVWCKACH